MTTTALNLAATTDRVAASSRPTRPVSPPRPHVQESSLRLTPRGRLAVVLFTLVVAFGGLAWRGAPAASTDVAHHATTSRVVVTPGETLWDIARRVAPTSDPRDVVAQIEELNALNDGGSIRVGQPLFVPGG